MSEIKKRIEPVLNRVLNLIARGVLERSQDHNEIQTGQVSLMAGEVSDDAVESYGRYGFTSHAKPGAEAIVLHVGGHRDHGIIICCEDRRYRLKGLQEGEVALYTDEGDRIKLARGRTVEIVTGALVISAGGATTTIDGGGVKTTGRVQAEGNIETQADLAVTGNSTLTGEVEAAANLKIAGNANVTGNVVSDGDVSDAGGKLAKLRDTFNRHDHPYTDTPAGPAKTGGPSQTA